MTHRRAVGLTIGMGLLLALPAVIHAEPTPRQTMFAWDAPADSTAVTGYWLYYAPEAESPRVYSNARRVEIPDPAVRQIAVVDFSATLGRLCARVTARNAAGQESDFSNEACGFFGIPAPSGLRVQ
ncbi:MAG TPA: hypothetical protein VNN55_03040 [bacterium]|nr:hypothetical protein [bacterium]